MEAVPEVKPGITREEFIKTYPYRDTTLEGELNTIIESGEFGIEKGLITREQLNEKIKEFNKIIDRTFEAVRAEEEAVAEAKIKYFRQQETKWRETAYKIAEEERGEAPFATAMEKAEDFARQARELEDKPPAVSVVDYDRQYSLEELREKARQEGLSPSGSKKEIAARLIEKGVT